MWVLNRFCLILVVTSLVGFNFKEVSVAFIIEVVSLLAFDHIQSGELAGHSEKTMGAFDYSLQIFHESGMNV